MYNQDNSDKVFFNQNVIYYKDKNYNSGGSLEITISNNTNDYKTFSAPILLISVIGENNLRRLCTLTYVDSVDLYNSINFIIQNIESIYATNRSNVLAKKYNFDKTLKFEFIQIPGINDRVVSISIIHNTSDFTKVVIPYSVFISFAIGILKFFVNQYIDISFSMSTRNLLTEILEQNKMIRNGITVLPSTLFEIDNKIKVEESNQGCATDFAVSGNQEVTNDDIVKTIDDFDKFLGKDMENIVLDDLNSKAITEEKKSNNVEVTSSFITKTLTNDMSVLESMLTSAVTRPDPMISLFEGFRRSMNLDESFTFLPLISSQDLKSFLYISKITHDYYLNSFINNNKSIPSGFSVLKYNIEDHNKVDFINTQISYDLLLITGFMKIFRNKIESREADINKNGSLFYLRLRTFLDPLVYSFLDETKGNMINTIICSNFDKYSSLGFFNHYQKILTENKFEEITVNDIRNFCNEVNDRILVKGLLSVNINDIHDNLFKTGFLRIKSDSKLSIEQIINELIPLEIMEKNGMELKEGSEELKKVLINYTISDDVLNAFFRKEPKIEKITNILKTVKFYDNEVPEKCKKEFFDYIEQLKELNFDFSNSPFEIEEFGENIIKSLYVWNESDNKREHLTSYREKVEECLLTKDLILAKYNNVVSDTNNSEDWNLDLFD